MPRQPRKRADAPYWWTTDEWVMPFAAWKPLRGRPAFLDWNHQPRKGAKGGNVVAVYPGTGLLP